MRTLAILTFIASIALSTAACGNDDPLSEIDEAANCNSVCNRYRDCFDNNYDTETCYDECQAVVDGSGDPHAADNCESCIDDMSCAGGVFNCATECGALVP